jgi:hypothetical protein
MTSSAPITSPEEHLGDGLYASFDGWQLILRAPREDGDHWVALDPYVYPELVRYMDKKLGAGAARVEEMPGQGDDAVTGGTST